MVNLNVIPSMDRVNNFSFGATTHNISFIDQAQKQNKS